MGRKFANVLQEFAIKDKELVSEPHVASLVVLHPKVAEEENIPLQEHTLLVLMLVAVDDEYFAFKSTDNLSTSLGNYTVRGSLVEKFKRFASKSGDYDCGFFEGNYFYKPGSDIYGSTYLEKPICVVSEFIDPSNSYTISFENSVMGNKFQGKFSISPGNR